MWWSTMVAWRFEDSLELAPYSHHDGQVVIHLPAITLHEAQRVKIYIDAHRVIINKHVYLIEMPFKEGWQINSWFGGKQPAPREIKIKIENE